MKKSKKVKNIDGWLSEIIDKAISAGKLFELIFTEEGKRIWSGYPEDKFRKMVQVSLKRFDSCKER